MLDIKKRCDSHPIRQLAHRFLLAHHISSNLLPHRSRDIIVWLLPQGTITLAWVNNSPPERETSGGIPSPTT